MVAGSAVQISTILSTSKYVTGCAWSGRRKSGASGRSDVLGIATGSVLFKCDRYDYRSSTVIMAFALTRRPLWTKKFYLGRTALFEYKFNLKNYRFLRAYLAGYVNGMNENSDTPYVSGGTCIKTD
jgi:hypothetical protein